MLPSRHARRRRAHKVRRAGEHRGFARRPYSGDRRLIARRVATECLRFGLAYVGKVEGDDNALRGIALWITVEILLFSRALVYTPINGTQEGRLADASTAHEGGKRSEVNGLVLDAAITLNPCLTSFMTVNHLWANGRHGVESGDR